MKKAINSLIQAAKAQADHRDHKAMGSASMSVSVRPCVSPVVLDAMMAETKWSTVSALAERFGFKWDHMAKEFKGRDGVLKSGSDYRVPEFAVRCWLAECAAKAKEAA